MIISLVDPSLDLPSTHGQLWYSSSPSWWPPSF